MLQTKCEKSVSVGDTFSAHGVFQLTIIREHTQPVTQRISVCEHCQPVRVEKIKKNGYVILIFQTLFQFSLDKEENRYLNGHRMPLSNKRVNVLYLFFSNLNQKFNTQTCAIFYFKGMNYSNLHPQSTFTRCLKQGTVLQLHPTLHREVTTQNPLHLMRPLYPVCGQGFCCQDL